MGEAPDLREAEDCPSRDACDGRCDQHASWVDRHGDVWQLGDDGLMHTPETAPFPREHVEKKWGPLRLIPDPTRDPRGAAMSEHETPAETIRRAIKQMRAEAEQIPSDDMWNPPSALATADLLEASAFTHRAALRLARTYLGETA